MPHATATAVVSLPPRPSVVMSPLASMPWKPATTGMRPSSRAFRMRSLCTFTIFALLCVPFVSMPAWRPVKLMAGYPMASRASASSVMETCSPVDSRRSSSRAGGFEVTARESPISSSVVLPMADTTATT